MIDFIFKILDKLLLLFNVWKNKKEKVFKEVIDPIYKDLEAAVQDYLLYFTEVQEYGAGTESKIGSKEVVGYFNKRRTENLQLRIKIRKMIGFLKRKYPKDVDIELFADLIHRLFYELILEDRNSYPKSCANAMLYYIQLIERDELPREKLRLLAVEIRDNIESKWGMITEQYMVLKYKFLM